MSIIGQPLASSTPLVPGGLGENKGDGQGIRGDGVHGTPVTIKSAGEPKKTLGKKPSVEKEMERVCKLIEDAKKKDDPESAARVKVLQEKMVKLVEEAAIKPTQPAERGRMATSLDHKGFEGLYEQMVQMMSKGKKTGFDTKMIKAGMDEIKEVPLFTMINEKRKVIEFGKPVGISLALYNVDEYKEKMRTYENTFNLATRSTEEEWVMAMIEGRI